MKKYLFMGVFVMTMFGSVPAEAINTNKLVDAGQEFLYAFCTGYGAFLCSKQVFEWSKNASTFEKKAWIVAVSISAIVCASLSLEYFKSGLKTI